MMKFHNKRSKFIILSLFMALLLAACTPGGSGSELEPDAESVPNLEGTSWVLEQFGPEGEETAVLPDTTITLNFADNGVNGSAGCNNYFGEAAQAGSALTLGAIGSTRMACPQPIMQQENDYLAALGSVNSFSLADEQLTLAYENGRLYFAATQTTDADEEIETSKTLFVGPELVDCVGVAPQQCLQVRENQDEEWTLFYDQIIGFEFEPGYEYELRVTETEIDNPPADASSLEVTLVEVVSQTAVSPTATPHQQDNELQGTSWVLASFGPTENQTAVLPDTEPTLNFEDGQINGHASCNSYFGEVTLGDDGAMTVGMIGSTLMACMDEDMMQQEADFMAALAQVTSYTLSGSQLTLHTADGVLNFQAAE